MLSRKVILNKIEKMGVHTFATRFNIEYKRSLDNGKSVHVICPDEILTHVMNGEELHKLEKEFYDRQDELHLEFLVKAIPLLTIDNLLVFIDRVCNYESIHKDSNIGSDVINIIDKVINQ